jgi:hypothetical protein
MLLTALTAGGSRDADMATPTSEPALPPSTERATPAPDGRAIKTPTQSDRRAPLKKIINIIANNDAFDTKKKGFLVSPLFCHFDKLVVDKQ